MLADPLANTLSVILNGQKVGKEEVIVSPISKTISKILSIMNDHNYIGKPEINETAQGKKMTIPLLGSINKCGAIKPRYSVSHKGFEKFEKRYLPAKDFGILLVSTPEGIMTHQEAKKKNLGGVLLAYCY